MNTQQAVATKIPQYAVGFCERGLGGVIIDLGAGADANHQVDHSFLWTPTTVIHAGMGFGVIEEPHSSFLQAGPPDTFYHLFAPPGGVDLKQAIKWARKCVELKQPYDMRLNIEDGVSQFAGIMFPPLRWLMQLFNRGPQPVRPEAWPSKNCVGLTVGSLWWNRVPGWQGLKRSMTPALEMEWHEAQRWPKFAWPAGTL